MAEAVGIQPPAGPGHVTHDPLRVAESADRDGRISPGLAACPECSTLRADLVALRSALLAAPLPGRPRDFQLTPADARRLRAPRWRRLLDGVGSARDAVTRPLAVGLTTLGLAGLLVATAPAVLPAVGGASSREDAGRPQVESLDMQASGAPREEAPGGAPAAPGGAPAAPGESERTPGPLPLVALSTAMLGAGAGLLVLRWRGRRIG